MLEIVRQFQYRALCFQQDAHSLLSRHEDTLSRVIALDKTRKRISSLSLSQKSLLEEAVLSIERGCFRAAHVMAWAAFIDYLEEKLASDNLKAIKAKRTGWAQYKSIEDLRENVVEYQLIGVAKDVGLLSKTEMKTLHGLLAKRNECAHPSHHNPDMNEAIGYVSELSNRIDRLEKKSL
jgi:hypothetical protein